MVSSRLIPNGNRPSTSSLRKPRCIRSSYAVRNDSSNVSSLLAPESTTTETNECSTLSNHNLKRLRLHKIHCDGCYCQDPPILPLLRLPLKHHRHNHHDANAFKPHYDANAFKHLHDASVYEHHHDSTTSQDHRDEERSSFQHMCHYGPDKIKPTLVECEPSKPLKVSVASQTQNDQGFEDVTAFRKDRYFECHSVQNLPDLGHKCVHKFTVNNRLMLEPINCDSFGVSRCEMCTRPMERYKQHDSPLEKPKTCVNDGLRKLYEHDLVPPRLNIASGGERIEIKVPEQISGECFRGFEAKRCMPLVSSFALRFQKCQVHTNQSVMSKNKFCISK